MKKFLFVASFLLFSSPLAAFAGGTCWFYPLGIPAIAAIWKDWTTSTHLCYRTDRLSWCTLWYEKYYKYRDRTYYLQELQFSDDGRIWACSSRYGCKDLTVNHLYPLSRITISVANSSGNLDGSSYFIYDGRRAASIGHPCGGVPGWNLPNPDPDPEPDPEPEECPDANITLKPNLLLSPWGRARVSYDCPATE